MMDMSKELFEQIIGYRFAKKETEDGLIIELYERKDNNEWNLIHSYNQNVFDVFLDKHNDICFNTYDKTGSMQIITLQNHLRFNIEESKQVIDKLLN